MSEFVSPFEENDASIIEQQINEALAEKFEGWSPAEGSPTTWLIKAFARISSTVKDQASVTAAAVFKRFGETIARVPPILAAPATVGSTWTMVDNAGYTIPAGTQVTIAAAGDVVVGFETSEAVTVDPGDTTASVALRAIEPGEAANGLTADPHLRDALFFVDKVESDGTTANGVDEEEEDAYLNRLTEAMQLFSDSPIVPRDWEIDARADAGVARALCLPGYDAEKEEDEQPLTVTVVPVDEDGLALSAGAREKLQERQAAKTLSGVLNFVAVPTYTEIDVEVDVTVLAGFDAAAVVAAVEARLTAYLSPANWGLPTIGASTSVDWENQETVHLNELISEVDRVGGVGRVVTLKLAESGDPLAAADVALAGVAPLTEPGEIEATAV